MEKEYGEKGRGAQVPGGEGKLCHHAESGILWKRAYKASRRALQNRGKEGADTGKEGGHTKDIGMLRGGSRVKNLRRKVVKRSPSSLASCLTREKKHGVEREEKQIKSGEDLARREEEERGALANRGVSKTLCGQRISRA